MPVSTMPTFAPPVGERRRGPAASQPSGASMSASAVPPVWPVLLRPYCSAKRGSFGVALARRILLSSAYCTSGERFSAATRGRAGHPDDADAQALHGADDVGRAEGGALRGGRAGRELHENGVRVVAGRGRRGEAEPREDGRQHRARDAMHCGRFPFPCLFMDRRRSPMPTCQRLNHSSANSNTSSTRSTKRNSSLRADARGSPRCRPR